MCKSYANKQLPRLLSGQFDVEAAETLIEEVIT